MSKSRVVHETTVRKVPCEKTNEKKNIETSFVYPTDFNRIYHSFSFEGFPSPKTFNDVPQCPTSSPSIQFDKFHQNKNEIFASIRSIQTTCRTRIIELLTNFHQFSDEQIESFFSDLGHSTSIIREEIQRVKKHFHHQHRNPR